MVRPVPKAALVPPLMLFLGIGDAMKITSVALAVSFPVLVNTLQGVRGVAHHPGLTIGLEHYLDL